MKPIDMDKLLEKAFAFRKTKIWKSLYDSDLIAIEHTDGSVGYCSIMGRLGQCIGLAVYPGVKGLDTMRRLSEDNYLESQPQRTERMMCQDCVSCTFSSKDFLTDEEVQLVRDYCSTHGKRLAGKDAWPQPQRFRPNCVPWIIRDEKDRTHLEEALDVCLALVRRPDQLRLIDTQHLHGTDPGQKVLSAKILPNGGIEWAIATLPDSAPVSYPTDVSYDELLAARVQKKKHRSGVWSCDVFLSPQAVREDETMDQEDASDNDAPYFPLMCMTMDEEGQVISLQICKKGQRYDQMFVNAMLQDMLDKGVPREIAVIDGRTYSMLSRVADYLGIRLTQYDSCPQLEDAEESFYEHVYDEDDEDDEGRSLDITEEYIWDMVETIESTRDFSEFTSEQLAVMYVIAVYYPEEVSEGQRKRLEWEFQRRYGGETD